MVKCPKCGEEFSLGRRLVHNCEDFFIYHGAICSEDRIDYPWNCIDIKKKDVSQLSDLNYLNKIEKVLTP